MTSEEEERPRFVTGGYGRHRRQWVRGLVNKYRGGGSLDFEPSQRGESLNFELAKGGGSSYLWFNLINLI